MSERFITNNSIYDKYQIKNHKCTDKKYAYKLIIGLDGPGNC